MDVASFDEIKDEFNKRVSTIVWCVMTTEDRKGRLRSRIIHPIWLGTTGYVVTGRESLKAKHLARNPYASITYWSPQDGFIAADVNCTWEESIDEKRRIWQAFKDTPMPYGYDPEMLGAKADDPGSGLLKLEPWRVELHSLAEVMQNKPATVWRA